MLIAGDVPTAGGVLTADDMFTVLSADAVLTAGDVLTVAAQEFQQNSTAKCASWPTPTASRCDRTVVPSAHFSR